MYKCYLLNQHIFQRYDEFEKKYYTLLIFITSDEFNWCCDTYIEKKSILPDIGIVENKTNWNHFLQIKLPLSITITAYFMSPLYKQNIEGDKSYIRDIDLKK